MKRKILIIEDEALISMALKNMLERNNFIVPVILSCSDEFNKINFDEDYDLILSDIDIDGNLNGYELTHKIRLIHNIPVIFLTNTEDELVLNNILQENPYGYLPKNINEKLLIKRINDTIDTHNKCILLEDIFCNKFLSNFAWRAIIENIKNPIYIKNIKKEYMYANKSLCKMLHKNITEILFKTDYDLFNGNNAREFQNQDNEVIIKKRYESFISEIELFGKSNTYYIHKFPIILDQNNYYIVGLANEKPISEESCKNSFLYNFFD